MHRQGNPLPPIGVATVYQQQTDSDAAGEQVPDDEHMTTEVPIEQVSLLHLFSDKKHTCFADHVEPAELTISRHTSHMYYCCR